MTHDVCLLSAESRLVAGYDKGLVGFNDRQEVAGF